MKIRELPESIAQGKPRFYIQRGAWSTREYMRSDGEWMTSMDAKRNNWPSGGTYFETRDDAQDVIDALKENDMEIEVGGVYKARNGDRVEIYYNPESLFYPYEGNNGEIYDKYGRTGGCYDPPIYDLASPWDEPITCEQVRPIALISEIDALAKKHSLTVFECSLVDGIYNISIGGD